MDKNIRFHEGRKSNYKSPFLLTAFCNLNDVYDFCLIKLHIKNLAHDGEIKKEGIHMDVNRIIRIVKGIPKEKWSDEKTIKKVIQDAGRTSGKTFSDAELNQYVQQFKSFAKGGLSPSLIATLLKNGVSKSQIDEFKNIMKDKQ